MEAFGIIGMSLGSIAFIFSLIALTKTAELERRMKEARAPGAE